MIILIEARLVKSSVGNGNAVPRSADSERGRTPKKCSAAWVPFWFTARPALLGFD